MEPEINCFNVNYMWKINTKLTWGESINYLSEKINTDTKSKSGIGNLIISEILDVCFVRKINVDCFLQKCDERCKS